MKKVLHISLFFALLFCLAGCSNDTDTSNNSANPTNTSNLQSTPTVNRVSTETHTSTIGNTITEAPQNQITEEIHKGIHDTTIPTEEEIASFSTKLGGKDTPRSRNIKITSTTLNETTVENGQTFSFCDTIGVCTAEKGYEKADTFDSDRK